VALVAGFILFAILDPPLGVILLAAGAVIEVGEAALWYRYLQRIRVTTGAESLPGRQAEVLTPCHPNGKVKLDGEIWNANCKQGANPGETVEIEEVDRLTLHVRPLPRSEA
jgi:membrane-bound serine protease (ClpP class)